MSEFIAYITEVLGVFGAIQVKGMFGGYGVYHDKLMFGIIADDVLYLKADEHSARLFNNKNLAQFVYSKKGKPVKMSFYTAPPEIYEDPDEAKIWVSCAYEAAMRSGKLTRRRKQHNQQETE